MHTVLRHIWVRIHASFLSRYTWDHSSFRGIAEEAIDVSAVSFGIGSVMNCNFALINVVHSDVQVSRGITANPTDAPMGNHPGAGANTIHHDVQGTATTSIPAG